MLKIAAPALFVLNFGILVSAWMSGSLSGLIDGTVGGYLIVAGDLAGLVAYFFVLCQLMLIARVRWIQRAWGHDKLSHVHHLLGLLAICIIGIHPVLMIIGYSSAAQTTFIGQFTVFLKEYDGIVKALIGYFMFLSIVGISLTIVRSRLRYESWYFVHVWIYVAVILVFGHQLANGHDFGRPWFVIYWKFLFYGTLACVVWYRFARPTIDFFRFGFFVHSLQRETHNVTSVIIGGRGLDRLQARAGQFIIVRFLAKGMWWQAHPFSLSEMPDGTRLRLTIKAVGDYTSKIPELKPGTRIIIEGPLGRFTADRASREKVALIAGGIGITPLRALYGQFMNEGRTVDLVYAARTEQDFALLSELKATTRPGGAIYLLPQDTQGHITVEILRSSIPDISSRFVYLCGPPLMMHMVRKQLSILGVPRRHVLFERFALG